MLRVATPDEQPLDAAARAVRMRHESREPPGADDQDIVRVVASQIARCEQRCRGSATQCQRFAVDDGTWLAVHDRTTRRAR